MKKIKIDRAIQERPATRKQTRNEKIRQSLTEHVDVQVIPAITDREGYPIKITCAPAANAVRRIMQWAPEENWNVPGAIFGDEKVIIYSLEQAYAPVPKGGWTAKKQAAAAAEAVSKVNAK